MRRKLWLWGSAVAAGAVVIVGVPALAAAAGRGGGWIAFVAVTMVVAVAAAASLAALLAAWLARPVEELAEAAGRLARGDPRPLGRRYGVADLDQLADGLTARPAACPACWPPTASSPWTPRTSCAPR